MRKEFYISFVLFVISSFEAFATETNLELKVWNLSLEVSLGLEQFLQEVTQQTVKETLASSF